MHYRYDFNLPWSYPKDQAKRPGQQLANVSVAVLPESLAEKRRGCKTARLPHEPCRHVASRLRIVSRDIALDLGKSLARQWRPDDSHSSAP